MAVSSMVSTMAFAGLQRPAGALEREREAVDAHCRTSEPQAVADLLAQAETWSAPHQGQGEDQEQAQALAGQLVRHLRQQRSQANGVDALMHEFSLSSEEGVALMCLAEALLRIPDAATRDRLIADKIGRGDWKRHIGHSPSLFVNAAAWGLLLGGKLVALHSEQGLSGHLGRLLARGGEPVVRAGVDVAMRMLGRQFVCGQTIAEALQHSRPQHAHGYRYSYDMLGEAAVTQEDALRYLRAYEETIHAIGQRSPGATPEQGPGISVKLSALHPRYSRAQRELVMQELLPRLRQLALLAARYNVGINIDAEEADRLTLSMDLLEALAFDPALGGFRGLGFVVQAYQKRCPYVLDWLAALARKSGMRFMVRLVKGAYWDSEIKRAQVDGLEDYPVFTRKEHTDLCWLVCARKLLHAGSLFYPQLATHNALSMATVHGWARQLHVSDFEFQCLHGMGEGLYDQVVGEQGLGRACRIYAPVGSHDTLLAYLVRRLLENGANSSFVNRLVDESIPLQDLLADPVAAARRSRGAPHPAIALPPALYGQQRPNSRGLDLASDAVLAALAAQLQPWEKHCWQAGPLLAFPFEADDAVACASPANGEDVVARVVTATASMVDAAARAAQKAQPAWQALGAARRAMILRRAADALQDSMPELLALLAREAGRVLPAGVSEVREAIDFLRYYASQAYGVRACRPLGCVACISPWNFPLAIFVGQIAAALAAGNVVLAKPAEQTPAIATRAVQLLHAAGVPQACLQLLPGQGATVGAALVAHPLVDGVMFTGSTEVAARLQSRLLARASVEGRSIPLVAETGGVNAMLVDNSALPEQVVQDVMQSAFDSAGQRCSALRLLCLQQESAERILGMLHGALRAWRLGLPGHLSSDMGPVIDEEARDMLQQHVKHMRARGFRVTQQAMQERTEAGLPAGHWFAATVIEVDAVTDVQREVFGPVLHVLRYRHDDLPRLLEQIAASGYGLTMGIQTRLDDMVAEVSSRARVGNLYVNRNMIGAVVGVQPFGGMGKSGTGPKAGGPHYLWRLVQAPPADRLPVARALPGPTGESNELRTRPRGRVLCLAEDAGLSARMADLARATGNEALAGWDFLDEPPAIAAVLADAASLPRLAAHEFSGGAPLILPVLNGSLPPAWLLQTEQVLTINTAAAGGNARLMSL